MRLSKLFGVVLLPLGATACEASLNLDRFHTDQSAVTGDPSAHFYDFNYVATEMQSHIGEYFEIRVVDKDNVVQMKAVYQGVTLPDFSIYLAKSIPKTNPPYRIDYWADHNDSLKYDGIVGGINDKDHAWRRVLQDPLPPDVTLKGDVYELDFIHDTNFTDIATDLNGNPISFDDVLLPLDIKVTNADAYAGKQIEVRVVDPSSGRLLAFHRQGVVTATYDARVTGVVDDTSPYQVSAFVDLNGDDKYSSDEPSWQVNLTSDKTGLVSTLDLVATPQTPISTGQP